MLYLLGLLAVCVGVVWALIYAFRKLPIGAFLLLTGVLALASVATVKATFEVYERRFNLNHVPDALGVSAVTYQLQASWGFGPGGNEAGILTYPLSEEVSRQVEQGGTKFLQALPPNQDQADRRWPGA